MEVFVCLVRYLVQSVIMTGTKEYIQKKHDCNRIPRYGGSRYR